VSQEKCQKLVPTLLRAAPCSPDRQLGHSKKHENGAELERNCISSNKLVDQEKFMSAESEVRPHAFVVEWREGFKINIPQVDQEHKHLFSLVKALNLETVDQTLEELLDYVVTHFSNEQALMEKYGYPAFEAHLQLHETFGTQVADFLSSGESWSEERIQNLRRFLNKWLIGHIMTHDLRFGKWLESQQTVVAPVKSAAPPEKKGFFARLFGGG
jgi:hemerythrin